MSSESDALEALHRPEDWGWAAAAVARSGDADRLAALVAAYDQPVEGSRRPLLDAMEAAGGVEAASGLADSEDPGRRRLAARLAHLLPDRAHVPVLERLVRDPDPPVAAEARAALRVQVRDADWRATVDRLADADDPALREAVAAWREEG
jgi:hypothetical protein